MSTFLLTFKSRSLKYACITIYRQGLIVEKTPTEGTLLLTSNEFYITHQQLSDAIFTSTSEEIQHIPLNDNSSVKIAEPDQSICHTSIK